MRLALLAAVAGWSGDASACVYHAVVEVFDDPPASLTDPDEIEAWKREQKALSEASAAAAWEQQLGARKAALALEAEQAPDLAIDVLAEDLTANLVPPLVAQFASRSDCGTLSGPEIRDPAGYLETESAFTEHLVEIGLLENAEEVRFVSPRLLRDLETKQSCAEEARGRVRRMLTERFRHDELAHVWSRIHRLDFNFNSVEAVGERASRYEPGTFRLLRFAEGRRGPLVFSEYAKPISYPRTRWMMPPAPVVYQQLAADTAELRRFLETDAVAVRLVDEIGGLLARDSERCPETTAEIAAQAAALRPEVEARRNRQARREPATS